MLQESAVAYLKHWFGCTHPSGLSTTGYDTPDRVGDSIGSRLIVYFLDLYLRAIAKGSRNLYLVPRAIMFSEITGIGILKFGPRYRIFPS